MIVVASRFSLPKCSEAIVIVPSVVIHQLLKAILVNRWLILVS
jgi:hypothetical protein